VNRRAYRRRDSFGGMSRRDFLSLMTAAAASAGVIAVSAGCAPLLGGAAGTKIGGKLNLCVWQGYDDPKAAKPFTDKYQVVTTGTYMSANEECLVKETAAPGSFDNIALNMTYCPSFQKAGLILPVDLNVVKSWPDIIEGLRSQPYITIDGKPWLVPYIWGTTCVVYNPKKVTVPTGFEFKDLAFDDKLKGRITVLDDPAGSMIMISLMNGFKNPTLITKDQLKQNVDLGKQLKSRLLSITSSVSDTSDAMVRGDSWVHLDGWEQITKAVIDGGGSAASAYPAHSWSWCDGWMVTSHSNNVATAWAYVNQMTSPEAMAIIGDDQFYAPSNKKAFPLLGQAAAAMFSITNLEPALAQSPVLPLPPDKSDQYSTFSDWQQAWSEIKGA